MNNHKLLISAESGDLNSLKEALNSGAYVNFRNPIGQSALHKAVVNNNINIIKYLVDQENIINYGINLDIKDKYGYSILHEAVKRQNLKVIELLLEAGADSQMLNNDDQTPKSLAESYIKWLDQDKNSNEIKIYKNIINIFEQYQ